MKKEYIKIVEKTDKASNTYEVENEIIKKN